MTTEPAAAKPIFVLGLQRSGTTWLANMLAAHPDVAAVEAADHHGIHESIFFSHFARAYGDLRDDTCFRRFIADFAASDYFILSEVDEALFWQRRPGTYPEAFRLLMDALSRHRGARHWVEKSPHHTLLADDLALAFPDARFICVVRRPATLIRSRLLSNGRTMPSYPRRLAAFLQPCVPYVFYVRTLERFAARCPRAFTVRYEDLVADPETQMRRVSSFLGLAFDPGMTRPRHAPNTSLRPGLGRNQSFTRMERAAIACSVALLRLVPLRVMQSSYDRTRRCRGVEWPEWCWRRQPRPGGSAGRHGLSVAGQVPDSGPCG